MDDVAEMAAIPRGDQRQRPLSKLVSSPLLIALALYLLLALLLLPANMSFYYKDEIAYVAAAERYASGDFANAPNSLWGPLVSWLIAIALKFGLSSIAAARSVAIAAGMVTLWAARRLGKTIGLPNNLQLVFLLILVPYLVRYALFGATDDLPLTALLTLYFSIIVDPRYPDRRGAGLLCGVLGGLAFFAKGFAFGFFLVHFTVSTAVHWIARQDAKARKRVLGHFAGGVLVFAALAAMWVAALNQKYGGISIGITGKYNYEMRSPSSAGFPTTYIGFVEPPAGTTVSIWEDPAYLYDLPQARACCLKHWTPFDSGTAFKHQLLLFKLNVGRTLMTFLSYSPFTLAVAFAGLSFCLAPFWPSKRPKNPSPGRGLRELSAAGVDGVRHALGPKQRLTPAIMLLTIVIYPIPYTLVFSDERFFWPVLILFISLGLYLLNIFAREYSISRRARAWIIGLFAASFLVFPMYKLSTGQKDRSSLAAIAHKLEGGPLTGARFASNSDYGASMVVGYYIKGKYYGSTVRGTDEADIAGLLRRQKIDYFFVWGAPAEAHPGMTLVQKMQADFRKLAIYRVDP